jgi:hypothetical protein
VEKKENRGSQERIDDDRLSTFRNLVYNLAKKKKFGLQVA